MTSHLRALLFDIDGTLVDTIGLIVEALGKTIHKHLGINVPTEELREIIGLPLSKQLRLWEGHSSRDVDYELMAADQIEAIHALKNHEKLFQDAHTSLCLCKKKGYQIALITSKNRHEMDLAWPRLELKDFVDVIITASDVLVPKPAPDPALEAIRRLDVDPNEALFIGDTTFDIVCGKRAKVWTGAAAWGAHTLAALTEAKPDILWNSPDQLLKWCESLPAINTHYAAAQSTN